MAREKGRRFRIDRQSGPAGDCNQGIKEELAEIKGLLLRVLERLDGRPPEVERWHSVEEAAGLLKKTPYTVRDWCRLGRVNAIKRGQRWGKSELWSISSLELERYSGDGLLPIDVARNAVRRDGDLTMEATWTLSLVT